MTNIKSFYLHPQLAKDSYFLGEFELSSLLLINDEQFPWFVLVPRKVDTVEIYQLTIQEQQMLLAESTLLSRVIMPMFHGDKLNVAAIGNLVPQLHLHHVVRYKNDLCWPSPIWGQLKMIHYPLEKVLKIQQKLANKIPSLQLNKI